MTTNRRLNKKGYSGLAFILLIVAMCFTAFIAVPFCETQASAALYEYNYDDAYVTASKSSVKLGDVTYQHVTRIDGGGGVWFGSEDKSGRDYIINGGHSDKTFDSRPDSPITGLQFPSGFYDFNTGSHTSLTTGKLSFNSFKDDSVVEVSLNDLNQMFGIGSSVYGYNSDKDGFSINATSSASSLNFNIKGWSQGTRRDTSRDKAWRIDNGLMYTFIKVPDEIAPYLSVSASASVTTKGQIPAKSKALGGGDYNYGARSIPFIDMQIGNKANDNFRDLALERLTGAMVTGTGTIENTDLNNANFDSGSNSRSTEPRVTSEVDMNGHTWIKLLFGVMNNDGDYIYTVGASRNNQEWDNFLNVSNVKLTFRLNAPNIHTSIRSTSESNYIKGTRTVSIQIALDKKQITSVNNIENILDPTATNNYIVKIYDAITDEEFSLTNDDKALTEKWYSVPQGTNGDLVTENAYLYDLEFKIKNNGKYRFRLYSSTNVLLQETIVEDDYIEERIDTSNPTVPTSSLPSVQNPDPADDVTLNTMWVSNPSSYFVLSNFTDTVNNIDNRNGLMTSVQASGVKKLTVYLRKANGVNLDDLQELTNKKDTYSVTYDLYGDVPKNIKITDLKADFFNYKETSELDPLGYGDYIVFYQVADAAGNISSLAKNDNAYSFFKYENEDAYKYSDFQIYDGSNWVGLTQFNAGWVNKEKIAIKFKLDNYYFYPQIFKLYDESNLSGLSIANFIETKENVDLTGDGLPGVSIVVNNNEKYYYAVVDLADVKQSVNIDTLITDLAIRANKLGTIEPFAEKINLHYDSNKPFDGVDPLYDVISNKNVDLTKQYTFKDNAIVLYNFGSEMNTSLQDGGMYFLISCKKENVDEAYIGEYTIKINNKNSTPQLFNGDLLIFIPKEDLNRAGGAIKVTDQAGNEGEISIPNILYDDTRYVFSEIINTMHFNSSFNDFISIVENVIDIETGLETKYTLNETDLSSITGREYAKGESILFNNVGSGLQEFKNFRFDGLMIGSNVFEGKTSYTFGDTAKVKIKVLVTKLIDIDVYVNGNNNVLTDNINTTPKIEYAATDLQLVIKNSENSTPVLEGINVVSSTSGVVFDSVWENIRNVTKDGISVEISIKDTVNRIETISNKKIVVNIVPKDIRVTLNGSIDFKENDTIEQVYGNTTVFNVSYTIPDLSSTVAFEFKSIDGTKFSELNANDVAYNVGLFSTIIDGTDNFNNYKFNLYYGNKPINQLKIKVLKREVRVVFGNIPQYVYGQESRDVSSITKVVNENDLSTNEGKKLPSPVISGNPSLFTDANCTLSVNYKTPANNLATPNYFIGTNELYINDKADNFILVPDGENNKFTIAKQNLTITLAANQYEYGNLPDFNLYSSLNFNGLVAGDDQSVVTINSYLIKLSGVNAVLNKYSQYNIGTYTIEYTTNGAALNNYEVKFDTQTFEIIPKEIKFGIDVKNAVLSKIYDGKNLIKEGTKYYYDLGDGQKKILFPIDIDTIKNQFIVVDEFNELYNEVLTNANAFTIKDLPLEVINVNGDRFNHGYEIVLDTTFEYVIAGVKNYKLTPELNVTKFDITPKTIDAEIKSFNFAGLPDDYIEDFGLLVRNYGEDFDGKTIKNFNFNILGNATIDDGKFFIKIVTESGEVKDFEYINDLTANAGQYSVKVYYDSKHFNYFINQKNVSFYILQALYTLKNEDLTNAINTHTSKFVYTGENILNEENNVVKVQTSDNKYVKVPIFTKVSYVNVGTGYTLYIDKGRIEIYSDNQYSNIDTNYGGVKLEGTDTDVFTFGINKYELTEANLPAFSKEYDGLTEFNVTLPLVGTPTSVNATFTGTITSADVNTYNTALTTIITNNNYDASKISKIKKDVVVNKRDAVLNYIGSKYVKDNSTFTVDNFVLENIAENDKKILADEIKFTFDNNPDKGLSDAITFVGSKDITFKYINDNYNVNNIIVNITIIAENNIVNIKLTSNNEVTYTGKSIETTWEVTKSTGEIISDAKLTYTINGTENADISTIKNAGKYTVVASYSDEELLQNGEKLQLHGENTIVIIVNKKPIDAANKVKKPTKEFDGTKNITLDLNNDENYGILPDVVKIGFTKETYECVNIIGESYIDYELKLVGDDEVIKNYELINSTGSILGEITKRPGLIIDLDNEVVYGNTLGFILPIKNEENNDIFNLTNHYSPNTIGNVEFTDNNVGENIPVNFSFTSPYYELDIRFNKVSIGTESGSVNINITKRTVHVDSQPIVETVGILKENIKLPAKFQSKGGDEGLLPRDIALFKAIENEIYTVAETKLKVGEYNIIKAAFEADSTIFKNYTLVINELYDLDGDNIANEYHTLVIQGSKVNVSINAEDIHFVYSNDKNPDGSLIDINAIKKSILDNMVITDIRTGDIIPLGDPQKELIDIYIATQGSQIENNLTEFASLNVNSYVITLKYNTQDKASQYYVFDTYSLTNTKVIIDKKQIELKFDESKFIKSETTGLFELNSIYGDNAKYDESKLNEILQAFDLSLNTKPMLTGEFKFYLNRVNNNIINRELNKYNYFDANIYDIDLSNIYISNKNKDQNIDIDNYEIILPSNIKQFKVNISPKTVNPTLKYYGELPNFEYGSKLPELSDSNWNVEFAVSEYIAGENLDIQPITELKREQGVVVGTYKLYVKFEINNKNYKLPKDKYGYVILTNNFVITPRLININSINFDITKQFNNLDDVKNISVVCGFTNDTYILGDEVESLFTFTGKYNSIHVNDANNVQIALTLKDTANYSFNLNENSKVLVNGNEVIYNKQNFNTTDPLASKYVVYKGKASITKAEYGIQLDVLKTPDRIVRKTYDGSSNFIDSSAVIEGTAGNIKFIYKGIFNSKLVLDANKLAFTIDFTTDINRVLENIQVTLNGFNIEFVSSTVNTYNYHNEFNGEITKRDISISKDSIFNKVYDGETNTNIYYDEKVLSQHEIDQAKLGIYNYNKDGNIVNINIKPEGIVSGDNVIINYNLGAIELPYANVSDNKVNVLVNFAAESTDKDNYELPSELVITASIVPREIVIKIKPDFKTKISKVYDGTKNITVNQSLNEDDYTMEGILAKHQGKLNVDLSGNAEFTDIYAGQNIAIKFNGASVVDIADDIASNYTIANEGEIQGLTGNILPREVYIDEERVIIYNTRYFGPERENYNVIVINDKKNGGDKDNTVSVYMPFKQSTASVGILDVDKNDDYKLRASIPMMFADNKITFREDVELMLVPDGDIKIVSDAKNNLVADKVARSYKIGNIGKLFNGDKLNVGINATGEEAFNHKVHIQQFIVKDEYIYFDRTNNIFDKVYDGTTNLNSRVVAKIGIFGPDKVDKAPFLTTQIKGLNILSKDNVYSSPNVGDYNISLKIDTDEITMNFGQSSNAKWYDLSQLSPEISEINGQPITSKITKRVVNVIITPNDKVYDGKKDALSGVNFTYEVPTATTGKLEGVMPRDRNQIVVKIGNAEYLSTGVGPALLRISGLYFDPDIGRDEVKNNYIHKIMFNGPNGVEQTDSRDFEINILPKELYVTAGNININYTEELPTIDYIKANISKPILSGLIETDRENDLFASTITYQYVDGYKPGMILRANSYKVIKIANSNPELYHNYKLVFREGTVTVNPLSIIVELDTTSKFLTGYYSNIVNNVDKAFILSKKLPGIDKPVRLTTVEANAVMNFFRVTGIPTNRSDAGKHELDLIVNTLPGHQNYSFNIDTFGIKNEDGTITKYVFEVLPINVPSWNITENQEFKYEFDENKDFNAIILNSCMVNDSTAYNRITKELVHTEIQDGKVVEKFVDTVVDGVNISSSKYPQMNKVQKYTDLGIKLTAEKYDKVSKTFVEDANYITHIIPIKSVLIVNKKIGLAMKDSIDNVFDGKPQEYTNKFAGIPAAYKDIIKLVFIDSNGNVVVNPTEVGQYTVLAYSTKTDYAIDAINSFIVSATTVKDAAIREACENGYASAKFIINKIVIRNIGTETKQTTPVDNIDDFAVGLLKEIKFNNAAIDINTNIELEILYTEMVDAGIYNVNIKLLTESFDKNNLQISNYIIDNPLISIQVVTNKITDNQNVIIKTQDGSNLNQDLVDAKLVYFEGTDQNKLDMLNAQKSLFGKIHQLVYAQFKINGKNVGIDSESVYLNTPVIVEIKLNPSFKGKDLYLVTDSGAVKKISSDKITYTTNEYGEASAKFVTDELGWFVYADAPVSKQARNATIAYSVLGCVIGAILIAFIILCIRAYKLKKVMK